jgi:hypothetical protein
VATNEAWHVAADVNVSSYEEAISTIRGDLMLMNEQKREFTSITELKQMESLVSTLEATRHN